MQKIFFISKKHLKSPLFNISIFLFLSFAIGQQDSLPAKTEIIETMRRVTDYYMVRTPLSTFVSSGYDGGLNWGGATYVSALLMLYNEINQQHYFDFCIEYSEHYNWKLFQYPTTHADHHTVGQLYIPLYNIEQDPVRIQQINNSVTSVVNSTNRSYWSWCDALHMAPPVFCLLAEHHNDDKYYEALYELFKYTEVNHKLYNQTHHLWHRDKNYLPGTSGGTSPNGKLVFWGRGNGWVMGGITKCLKIMRNDAPHREYFITIFREMAKALKDCQRTDGFWDTNLGDNLDYPGPETSGTVFFVFGIAYGINSGLLDRNEYYDVIKKGWEGLNKTAVYENGHLGYVQPVGQKPGAVDPQYSRDYAFGGFLNAGLEVLKLGTGKLPDTTNLVLNKTIAQSSQSSNYPASNLTDGNIRTYWASSGSYPQWVCPASDGKGKLPCLI